MFTSALKSFTSNISANYTVSNTPTSIAGAWKVYDGKKRNTGKAVSIFVFERKSLEPQSGALGGRSAGPSLKKIHDEVIERLKKEASSLARLRHPNVLELAEPIEDTRNGGLMFATEPITASLTSLLQEQDNQERVGGGEGGLSRHVNHDRNDGPGRRVEFEFDELEIQKGLLQVAKGLEFLHESAGLVHGNLTPDAIYINQKSDWKISGLGFSGPPDTSIQSSNTTPIALSELLYHDPRLPRAVQLNLDYTSPDFVLDSNVTSSADMFSLGLVILALYNSPHNSPLHTSTNISTYKKLFASSSSTPSPSNNFLSSRPLPKGLVSDVLPRLITRRPAQRMNAREFQQSQFFDNILVSAIRFLDSLPAKNPNEKSQFMRGLPRILEQFPKSVLGKKVLPALLEETKDRELLSLILQNVFKIIKILPSAKGVFINTVIPKLREVFLTSGSKGTSNERDLTKEAGLVVLLENMALIAENCSGKEFKDDILPILQLGLESPTHALVDKSLRCLTTILTILDFSTIKNELFPVVAAVFSKTSSLAIKVRGLEAFVVLCGGTVNNTDGTGDGLDGAVDGFRSTKLSNTAILDKYSVQEKIVPLLKAIKTKEPAVMMAALAVFKQVGKVADSDFLAMDVLPILWSFSLGPLLNLQQFQEYMDLIKGLSAKIEHEQTKKLRELSSNTPNSFDNSRSDDLMSIGSQNNAFGGGSSVGENDFERLVLGKTVGTTSDILGTSRRPQTQGMQPLHAAPPAFSWSSPAQTSNSWSNMSGILTPTPISRAITPDQSLSNFAALKPSSATTGMGNASIGNSWTGMQQSLQPTPASMSTTSSWANALQPNTNMSNGMSNPGFHQALQPTSNQSAFSIPRPPSTSASNKNQQKGLDAYESLL